MVEDLAARAFAEGESGLRVSARIVKELFESEATMVSTSFFALLTCCTKDEEGLGLAMVGRLSMQDCVVKAADRSCEEMRRFLCSCLVKGRVGLSYNIV